MKRYVSFDGDCPQGLLVPYTFSARGGRAIAENDPSGGEREEAEKRGSIHGGSLRLRLTVAGPEVPGRVVIRGMREFAIEGARPSQSRWRQPNRQLRPTQKHLLQERLGSLPWRV